MVVEAALNAELTEHLGYPAHAIEGRANRQDTQCAETNRTPTLENGKCASTDSLAALPGIRAYGLKRHAIYFKNLKSKIGAFRDASGVFICGQK